MVAHCLRRWPSIETALLNSPFFWCECVEKTPVGNLGVKPPFAALAWGKLLPLSTPMIIRCHGDKPASVALQSLWRGGGGSTCVLY